MSNSQPSTNVTKFVPAPQQKFWVLAAFTIVLTAGLTASAWPAVLDYTRTESNRLSTMGQGSSGSPAELDFHLAYLLNSHNQTAAIHFASQELARRDNQAVLDTLKGAGESGPIDALRIPAYLETGQTASAVSAADRIARESKNADELAVASLAYGVAGDTSKIAPLVPRIQAAVGDSRALQRVQRAQAGDLALATELYVSGLQNSSSALLAKLSDSVPRDVMLGQLNLDRHTKASLAAAANYYRLAIKLAPADLDSYTGLIAALTAQKDQTGAAQVTAQLKQLQSGQL